MAGDGLISSRVHRLRRGSYEFLECARKLASQQNHAGRRGERDCSALSRVCGYISGEGSCRVKKRWGSHLGCEPASWPAFFRRVDAKKAGADAGLQAGMPAPPKQISNEGVKTCNWE